MSSLPRHDRCRTRELHRPKPAAVNSEPGIHCGGSATKEGIDDREGASPVNSRAFGRQAMGRKRRRRWLRLAGIIALAYVTLWGVTQVFGSPKVRLAAESTHLPPATVALRWSECRAFAVAPFLVRADCGWRGKGALQGEGGATLYLWVGRPFAIWKFSGWIA